MGRKIGKTIDKSKIYEKKTIQKPRGLKVLESDGLTKKAISPNEIDHLKGLNADQAQSLDDAKRWEERPKKLRGRPRKLRVETPKGKPTEIAIKEVITITFPGLWVKKEMGDGLTLYASFDAQLHFYTNKLVKSSAIANIQMKDLSKITIDHILQCKVESVRIAYPYRTVPLSWPNEVNFQELALREVLTQKSAKKQENHKETAIKDTTEALNQHSVPEVKEEQKVEATESDPVKENASESANENVNDNVLDAPTHENTANVLEINPN